MSENYLLSGAQSLSHAGYLLPLFMQKERTKAIARNLKPKVVASEEWEVVLFATIVRKL
jgi:hypothetical protein